MVAYLRLLARFCLVILAITTVSRVLLCSLYAGRVAEAQGWSFILLQGLRFDLVLLGLLLLLPGIVLPWFTLSRVTAPVAWSLTRLYLVAMALLVLFVEFSTPSFIDEYDTRPNYLFVEYLAYPREVLATLWGAYPAQLIGIALLLPAAAILLHRVVLRPRPEQARHRLLPVAGTAVLFVVACPLAIRSTLAHRPVNPSTVATAGDAMVNTLPLPSAYSLAYALYESRLESEGGFAYGKMPESEVLRTVLTANGADPNAAHPDSIPTLRPLIPTHQSERPLNLVIILEESLGAEYVGSLGGPPITPRLDQLAQEGLWFSRLYSTVTRSVRGIEAVITGFLPTPTRAIVKLPRTQRGVFSIPGLLQQRGYRTSFLYGGEAHFDNMGRFLTGNGVDEIIDERNFPREGYAGSWGYCDGDLFDLAHEYFAARAAADEPFFSLVFTSSNHSPFDFPYNGEFPLHNEPRATVHNAVKYADDALGRFFDKAKASDYWDNTVFLVVADHNSRVRGASLVPIERFHIPGLFLGGSIQPEVYDRVCSQVDLVPTALSLIGVEAAIPGACRDLSCPEARALPGRAIMQYHDNQAYLEGDRVVVQRRDLEPVVGSWLDEAETIELDAVPQPDAARLQKRALAYSLLPQISYRKGWHRLPE